MNIIFVTIDTLRYDYIGAKGNDRIRTPNIDRLAEKSWVFDRNFAASFPTIPHRTDVMTGRYGGPFHSWAPLRHDAVTLPRTLAEAGYATQIIHDTPHLVNGGHNFDWPFHAWTFVRGAEVDRPWLTDNHNMPENWQADPIFDDVDADPWSEVNVVPTHSRSNRNRKTLDDWNAAKLFSTTAEFVRDNAKRDNFFLWVDSFDPHEPWDAPREFMKMYVDDPEYDGRIDPRSFTAKAMSGFSPESIERIRAAYAAKLTWMDHCFGKMLDAMDECDMWKNTAIIFTADHGTRMCERGEFGKVNGFVEEVAHTPFMVYAPEAGSGRSDMIVQPQDVFATACSLAGVAVPEGIESHDVLSAAREGSAGARTHALIGRDVGALGNMAKNGKFLFAIYDKEWCLLVGTSPSNSELNRLGSTENVAADHPDVVAALFAEGHNEIERRGLDPAIADWLRSGCKADFPENTRTSDNRPAPDGYYAYFNRLCHD